MSEFPRAQKIAALVLITLVVVATLIVLAARDGDSSSVAAGGTEDSAIEPTAIPVLQRPRDLWSAIEEDVRGAQGTTAPVDCPFVDERTIEENNFLSLTPGLTFICRERGVQARPIAPGRVVMRVTQPPLNSTKAGLVAADNDGPWLRASAYGPFVVIDHGPLNGVSNVTSVYAGLESLNDELQVGQLVDSTTALGTLGAVMINGELVPGVMAFELLTDDTRFGGDPMRQSPGSVTDSPRLASLAAEVFTWPVTSCTPPFGNPNLLVGAPRAYRSGIHNGLDFNCIGTNHTIKAAGAGQVIFVVDDYENATPTNRDAVLAQAVPAFDTPFWTLANLYGNFVVIDHVLPSGERAVTIYAHLSEVDTDIVTGVIVEAGTPLGLVGNSGTSAAAAGILGNDGSIHLHWELHVNDRPIGYLEPPADTAPLYQQILCSAADIEAGVSC